MMGMGPKPHLTVLVAYGKSFVLTMMQVLRDLFERCDAPLANVAA
jgi:hypothetical protein